MLCQANVSTTEYDKAKEKGISMLALKNILTMIHNRELKTGLYNGNKVLKKRKLRIVAKEDVYDEGVVALLSCYLQGGKLSQGKIQKVAAQRRKTIYINEQPMQRLCTNYFSPFSGRSLLNMWTKQERPSSTRF